MSTRFLPRGLDAFPSHLGAHQGNKHDALVLAVILTARAWQ